ncbi:uncharacterized protein BCR38DRAFT_78358 [Pseudomassariella vexata]|uniref:Uncharacterized protein n=1 Tax=Pseudomassariella vexata TaxID=1141098 RepID=A0A1Y2DG18_9PEZI|nr:uncharacterized protein BCR38DRAFT_78358 [Pseudomassariella vexata]ORY58221.1 hypothetical protein BCR38DRAFT_78358 [Pseudomassariella vexata]
MTDCLGLLLLPTPPQQITFLDVRVALHPPLSSAVLRLSKARPRQQESAALLEIAIPLTRVIQNSYNHQELFAETGRLLFNVYQLLETIYQKENIPSEGPGAVDTRILFVHDGSEELDDGEGLPLVITSFGALARTSRPWTHLFAVESEPGETLLRRFMTLRGGDISRREHDPLLESIQRLKGGLQIYMPSLHSNGLGPIYDGSRQDSPTWKVTVVIGGGGRRVDFTDKYLLTMGLLSIAGVRDQGLADPGRIEPRALHVAILDEGDHQLEMETKAFAFIQSLTGFLRYEGQSPTVSGVGVDVTFQPLQDSMANTSDETNARVVVVSKTRRKAWEEILGGRDRGKNTTIVELNPIEPAEWEDD